MKANRRTFLKVMDAGGAFALLAGAGFAPDLAMAADMPDPLAPNDKRKEFDTRTLNDVVKDLGGSSAQASTDITMTAPDIAENGAVVPVTIESKLPGTKSIAIVVEKNPRALTAVFHIPEGTEPFISTRIKLAETAPVIALVQTDKGFFTANRIVKVTLGGCGG